MKVHLSFLGAKGTVTGSKYLMETAAGVASKSQEIPRR